MLLRSRAGKVAALSVLYLAQGLPFGFQATALPVFLRASGVSLTAVGFAGALALPWAAKALWAPLVDRFGWERFGRRRSWIVPLGALLALTCMAAAFVPPSRHLGGLLALVFLMNLLAATQDIAVDGLAIDVLGRDELGLANAGQVVGYKVGMLTAGGLLVWASAWIGWHGQLSVMAALVLLSVLAVFALREPPASEDEARERRSLHEVLATALAALRAPGARWLMAFLGTYKLGEAMVDAMFKPFLVDAGFPPHRIGLWVGTYGMVASIAGSLAGGWLAQRLSLLAAVGVTSVLRSFSMAGEWVLAAGGSPEEGAVVAVTLAEHLFGGALTTAVFAFMMSRARRSIGATHYTVLASVEVLGKSPAVWLSGTLAERWGYSGLFAAGTGLSVAFLALLIPLRRERERMSFG
ncbi:MFS transporter [Sorangium cellulosum]|uniref:MFS transporter n=1 Tax=Sorangium cellulosum TaxID=56 RepID=UPI0010117FF9|nr:MFS transporter [Sorangium cellulosum]